ncbi:MAG: hypothetical protein KA956_06385 [Pyrinomonadaceae bacterium]|nr:hypothetical protein [Acidobacteriota bacterium]MBP7376086.1 hypothetical protein [Pyrinomonadaceae bacterium]
MELEFDKEMDAILRRARGGSGVPVTSAHLDADTIAAFVENALPPKAKLLNMEHFADCDRCRKQLAFAMSMNGEAETTEAASVVAPIVEAAIPWYSKLFRTPNLALAMGALVVAFSGIIGYLAIQNRNAANQSDVAMANKAKPAASEPAAAAPNQANTTQSNSAVPAPSVTAPANSDVAKTQPATAAPEGVTGRTDQPEAKKPDTSDTYGAPADKEIAASKSAVTEPAPSITGGQPAVTREERNEVKLKDDDAVAIDRSKTADERGVRDGILSAPKKSGTGPTRNVGPSMTQQQSNSNIYTQTPIRSVGGKNFDNRGGVWYDTSFNGQPMIRVTRGSDAYKDLDGSIKRIAESLGGTVVVVWKAKAYRIQ